MNPKMQTGGSARELLPSLTAGLLNGMLVLIFQSAYAALIFAGPLAAFLPQGTGILLFGAIVMSTVVSLLSGFSTTVTAPQDAPTAIMAVVAAAIATQMGMDNPQSTFWTIVIGMGLTALASGLFLWLLGQYKLGNLIRFIPYPVVGGFLAGTGWVLVKGAVAIMAGITLNLETAHRIFEGSLLLHWLPGVLYGIVLLIVQKRFRHFLVMPSMILGAIILFYGVLFLSQLPIAEARALGWLPPSFPGDVSWSPPSPEVWGTVDWAVLTQQAGNLATIMIISVISLLLNASAAPDESFAGVDVAQARIERLDRDRLAGDEAQLAEVFGLLVSAHYRTRPLDLRHLLDGPNLEVWIARLNGSVAAVALVAREGGFDAQLAERIGAGLTRPHGHLLPETLASHMGLVTAAGLSAIRVLRIAVHPAVQRQGLGSQMLDQLVAQGAARGFAYAGGSFGADPGLVHFWRRAGFEPVRISARANAASGAHSVLMLCGMSVDGAGVVHRARRAFARDWPVAFGDGLNGLDPDLALELCRGADPGIGLDADERSALAAFAHGRRIVEAVAGPLWRFAASELAAASLSSTAARLLLVRVIQRGDWTACARRLGLSGRAELVERLRAAVRERVAAPGDTTGAGA